MENSYDNLVNNAHHYSKGGEIVTDREIIIMARTKRLPTPYKTKTPYKDIPLPYLLARAIRHYHTDKFEFIEKVRVGKRIDYRFRVIKCDQTGK